MRGQSRAILAGVPRDNIVLAQSPCGRQCVLEVRATVAESKLEIVDSFLDEEIVQRGIGVDGINHLSLPYPLCACPRYLA